MPKGRHFLDGIAARAVALCLALGAGGLLFYLDDGSLGGALFPGQAASVSSQSSGQTSGQVPETDANPAFTACHKRESATVKKMQDEGLISAEQASLFQDRAEARCRAQHPGS